MGAVIRARAVDYSRLVADRVSHGAIKAQEESQDDVLAGGNDLRVDDFPPVHMFGEFRDAAEEVNGEAFGGSDRSHDCADGLSEGDDPVLGHAPESTEEVA